MSTPASSYHPVHSHCSKLRASNCKPSGARLELQKDILYNGVPRLAGSRRRGRAQARRRRLRLERRPRHVLRRQRRLRHHGRSVRLRQLVQCGVRDEHGGAEHRAVQQRAELRRVLRDPVLRQPQLPVWLRHSDGHQLLPAQLRAPQQRRRVVQPATAALRPRRAGLLHDRPGQRRRRARPVQEGGMRQAGQHPVHHLRPLLLRPGADHERRRRRRRDGGVGEGDPDRVAVHEPQLGRQLAEQRPARPPGAVVPGHHQRRPQRHVCQRRAEWLELRPDLLRQPVLAAGRRPPATISSAVCVAGGGLCFEAARSRAAGGLRCAGRGGYGLVTLRFPNSQGVCAFASRRRWGSGRF